MHVPASGPSAAMSMNLEVGPGELVMILSADRRRNRDIVDRLLGLNEPPQAGVTFLGHPWMDQAREQAFLLRRQIGRVQGAGNWMESRSVMDNILLPAMHNTIIAEQELKRDAGAMAKGFGLPGLPTLPPAQCPPADLRRAACVRAFLGRPSLVILEHPLDAEDDGLLSPMMTAIQRVRRRRGAVLWFTEHFDLAVDRSIPADRRLQIVGARLAALRS